jgi:hypothetical protein
MRTAQAIVMMGSTLLLASGCTNKPRAPVLSDDPVYQNNHEGFRFLAPEGWTQSTRSDFPSGRRDKETSLVAYRRETGQFPADFRVSFIDLPPLADLAAFVAQKSYGVAQWTQVGAPKQVSVGKATGTRYILSGQAGKEKKIKEVVCLRRGERVYLFTGMYEASDSEARDQLRRVVDSIIWKE